MENTKNNPDFESVNCLICDSSNSKTLFKKGQHDLPTFSSICKDCGFVYLNPRWTKLKYNEFYKSDYDDFYRPEVKLNKNTFIESAKTIVKRIDPKKLPGVRTILDVGSGNGATLNYIKELNQELKLYAIESSLHCQLNLKELGITLVHHDVDSDWHLDNKNKFDIIILRHVLEHFLNPFEILKKINYTLSDNGIVYMAVPNMFSPKGSLTKYWFRIVHVSYFNKSSLLRITSKAGLIKYNLGSYKSELYAIFKKGQPNELLFKNKYVAQLLIIYYQLIKNFVITVSLSIKRLFIK